jgi:hypothetical protein
VGLGLAAIGALFAGALDLELPGFRIITMGESIWFILAAILLLRTSGTEAVQAVPT